MRKSLILGVAALLAFCGMPSMAQAATPTPPPPVASSATSPRVRVMVLLKDQPTAPDRGAEQSRLAAQKELIADWSDRYQLAADRQFGYLVNGFSAEMPLNQMQSLAMDSRVLSVRKERVYQQVEYSGRDLEGVPAAYQNYGVDGTGMVVSIIDSGIDTGHRDMRLDDCSKAKIQTISTNGAFTCKVPAGYNYADQNFIVKDATANQHGMHVAGIVAANGSEGPTPDFATSGRIDGVAPNAQLLAMKVFSNSGGGAQDANIIAAIEDSVKMGADVINMSLGSPNQVKDSSDGASRAMDLARKSGVMVVVAAGNEGLNFSQKGDPTDTLGYYDDGTAGSPAVLSSAITVASIDNAVSTQSSASWTTAGKATAIPYELAAGTPDGTDHVLVDAGLGRPEDYPAGVDVAGKYVIVERGSITFSAKFQNAVDKGAAGVIVFNSAAGGDAFVGMAGVDAMPVFGASIRRSDGLSIRTALAADPGVTIRFTTDNLTVPNPTVLQPSDFTSWGTTTTLDFEPEIAGIGGSVYSTINDNRYTTKSGTSMASPNVAGVTALVMQDLRKKTGLTGPALLDRAQTVMMNTAQIPMTAAGTPAAPRQIGAGLVRADLALASRVLATVDGAPSVALRQIDGQKSFTVTLTNTADTPASFTVPVQSAVVSETNTVNAATTTYVSGGTLTASTATVDVPANGTATVTFTVNPDTSFTHFLEGWAQLTSTTDTQPDLKIPFMGFVGDWNAEKIVAPAGEDLIPAVNTGLVTSLATSWSGVTIPIASDMGTFLLSANGDGDMDIVGPLLAMRRNAQEVRYSILKADGTPVKDLGGELDVRRETLVGIKAAPEPTSLLVTGRSFDGFVWDAAKGDLVRVPDGQYIYRVQARLGEQWAWQTTDFPFGVDSTAPVLTFGEPAGGKIILTATESGSSLMATPDVVAADGTALPVKKLPDGTFEITLPAGGTPFITASVVDFGFNLGTATKVFGQATLVVADANYYNDPANIVGASSPVVSAGKLTVPGYVSGDVATVRIGGESQAVTNGRFSLRAPLVEGKNSILVEGLDASGKVIASVTITPTYDSHPPTVDVTGVLDANKQVILAADGTVTVTGKVADERVGAKLAVTVDGTTYPVNPDGTFTATFTPKAGATTVAVKGSDGANTTTVAVPIAGRQSTTWTEPKLTNVDCVKGLTACFVPAATTDISADKTTFTLKGKFTAPTSKIVITPQPSVAGTSVGTPTPVTGTISADGTFSIALPMRTGINQFRVQMWDASGKAVYDAATRLYYDVTDPTVHFTEPVLYDGTLYVKDTQVTMAGSAFDDGWGYKLSINDSNVLDVMYNSGLGPDSNKRVFSKVVGVANGDQLMLVFTDTNGNALSGVVPVVVDTVGPDVTVPVTEGQVIADGRTLQIVAQDPHLATLKVTLNGAVLSSQQATVVAKQAPLESVLVKANAAPGPADASAAAAANSDPKAARAAVVAAPTTAPSAASGNVAQPTPVPAAVPAAAPMETQLGYDLATATLVPGTYSLVVESTDLAGNATVKAVSFVVNAAPVISGPDATTVTVGREMLGDQKALAALVLATWGVTDDQTPAAALAFAPGTVLMEGANTVTVMAGDGVTTTQRTVTVTVELKQVTLASNGATATSTFRTDDALTATPTANADGSTTWVLGNAAASQEATITLPGAEGMDAMMQLPNGTWVAVPATWSNGVYTLTGPSHATYKLTPKPVAAEPNANGETRDVDPITPSTGSSTTGTSGGQLAATGLEASAGLMGIAGAVLVACGVGIRRRNA